MRQFARLAAALGLAAALLASACGGVVAQGPAAGGDDQHAPVAGKSSPAPDPKNPIRGYTRVNKKTGQPVPVRPYERRRPPPRGVEVRPYERKGKPVRGHRRRKPGADGPAHAAGVSIRPARMA